MLCYECGRTPVLANDREGAPITVTSPGQHHCMLETLLEDIALLLRREHSKLEARLDRCLEQQDKIFQQISQQTAQQTAQQRRPPTTALVPGEPAAAAMFKQAISFRVSRMQGNQHSPPEDDLCSIAIGDGFVQVVPSHRPESVDRPFLEPKDIQLTSVDENELSIMNWKPQVRHTQSSEGSVKRIPSDVTTTTTKRTSGEARKPRNFQMQLSSSSQVFLREVKLGVTSAERFVKESQEQFKRLANDRNLITMSCLMKVVCTHAGRFSMSILSADDIRTAIESICPCVGPGQHPEDCDLNIEQFLLLMLWTGDITETVEQHVICIQEAFNNEKLAHREQLKLFAANQRKKLGGYDDLSLTADIVGASVIMLNGLTIGINSDVEPEHVVWRIIELGYLLFFTAEVMFHVYRKGWHKYFFGRDWRWNVFDSVLVMFGLMDALISEIASSRSEGFLTAFTRMLRLARLSRLVRLLRFNIFADLKQMIYGVIAGLRVLAWAVVLLIVFIYMVSLMIRQTMGDDEGNKYASMFQNVPWTMFTVFRCFTEGCTAPDGRPLEVYLYSRYGYRFMLAYSIMFLFVSIGIFNLIMASFVDNVMVVSAVRKQVERANSAEKLKVQLVSLILQFWYSDPETLTRRKTLGQQQQWITEKAARNWIQALREVRVTREMLQTWMCHPDMISLLEKMDIAIADHSLLFDALDCDLSGELEGQELVQGLMSLRGPTEKIDVVATMLAVKYMTAMLIKVEAHVCPQEESDVPDVAHRESIGSIVEHCGSITSEHVTVGAVSSVSFEDQQRVSFDDQKR